MKSLRCITLRTSNCPKRNWKCTFLDRQRTKSTMIFWYYYVFISCFILWQRDFPLFYFIKYALKVWRMAETKASRCGGFFVLPVNSPYASPFWTQLSKENWRAWNWKLMFYPHKLFECFCKLHCSRLHLSMYTRVSMGWWLLRLSAKSLALLRLSVNFFQLRLTKKLKINFFCFKKLNIN